MKSNAALKLESAFDLVKGVSFDPNLFNVQCIIFSKAIDKAFSKRLDENQIILREND